jgi:hypothetical protein
MKSILSVAGLTWALVLMPFGVHAQQIDTGPFLEACYGNPNLMPMTSDDPVALEGLCNCMARDFSENVSASDLDILTRELLGQLSDDERMGYETYEDLSAYAGDALNACLLIEGLVEGEAAAPAEET